MTWTHRNIYKQTYAIIKKLGCGKIKQGDEYFSFFLNLIYRHHRFKEKIGEGIRCFRIKMTEIDPSQYELQIKRRSIGDEEIQQYGKYKYESFDWYYCSTGIKASDLTAASSRVVGCFRYQYKLNNRNEDGSWTCKYCEKNTHNSKEIHTDHIYPQSKLLEDYCRTRNDIPSIFDKDKQTNETKFKSNDRKFHKGWIKYHNEHAEFQLLCKECNREKGVKTNFVKRISKN